MAEESLPQLNLVPAEETTVSVEDDGPGTLLRKKREKTKFDIRDVAIHLHLAPKVIEAIESNDFTQAPNRVFIRGYLRAYAKLLNMIPDEVLSAYDKLGISDAPVHIATDVIYKRDKGFFETVAPWVFTLLIGGMIFLVIFLWYSQHSDVSS
ncbi:MAG: helix-turn-helix domain-containing protein, partial [Gammaproteobacteria bacterium]